MGLNPGTRLGAYEILSPLGAGGMGEVYKARDTRLDRYVALKLLTDDVAGDADRLARFEREARAASALNHPAIVTIYDVGSANARSWISMELVEGKTLRELLANGPLPLRRALTVAAQIADGLAKAHEAGIIHRDLKPENVMVSSDGFAKILDFGLARLTAPPPPHDAETRPMAGTHPGMVMGTLAYMSPEQASGASVDFRSDQFSFGAVLYELLTGRSAFGRDSSIDTLSAILRDHPTPIGQLNPAVPPPVRWIVERCVEKQPSDRYASTRDLARDLAHARDHLSEMATTAVVREERPSGYEAISRRERLAWTLAVLLPLAVGALMLWAARSPAELNRAAVRLSLAPPENVAISRLNVTPFELSPDGRRLALVGVDRDDKRSLWVRSLDSLTWQHLAGTEGAVDVFWSPDGGDIGFFTEDKLLRVPVSGGDVKTICEVSGAVGGTWSDDGVILFHNVAGVYRVAASGGTPTRLTVNQPGDQMMLWLLFLPDGRRFLHMTLGGESPGLYLSSLDSTERKMLKPMGPTDLTVLGFTDPDYLLFVQNRNLMAQRLDLQKGDLVGDVIRIAEGVEMNAPSSAFSVSRNGTVVYWTGSRAISELTWVDRQGRQVGDVAARGAFVNMSVSPDGQRLAVGRDDTNPFSIWTIDVARGGTTTRVTTDYFSAAPSWSADGTRLAFGAAKDGPPNIYVTKLDRSGPDERLTRSGLVEFPLHWSPDAQFLVFRRTDPKSGGDIWLVPTAGDRTPRPLVNTPFFESEARVSPDGRWMAYVSNESGRDEVYVTSFPSVGDRWKVSLDGGSRPLWRRDGRELYYRQQGKIMAASVGPGPQFNASAPTLLFEASSLLPEDVGTSYDVSPDGRFLLNRIVERISAPMTVVTDWRAGLGK